MAVEIEAKLRFDDLDLIRERLGTSAAALARRVLETNIFFDTEDRSLLAADEGLRLRVNRDLESGSEDVIITYKGPRQHGQLKSREETELSVASAIDAATLLEKLGYSRVLTFEKRRESWRLDECHVELDELPYLGTFVEIEGPNEETVLSVKRKLGLADLANVKASYIAMLMTHLQEHGIANRVIRFDAPAGS